MNVVIKKDSLAGALQKLYPIVERKNTVEVLGSILCIAKENSVSLCSTNLEVGMKIILEADVQKEGRLTLSAKQFFDIVKELPNQPIHIFKKENNWVELHCGKAKFNIVSLSADDYPKFPEFEDKPYLEARTNVLIEMIDRTEFAVSTDATRYHMTGVFFEHLENGIMRMTATDGHRLSFMDNEVFMKMPELKRGVIIPKKGLIEFKKLMMETEGTIQLYFEKGYLFAKNKGSFLFVRLIDGEYPDYRLVIPNSVDKLAKMKAEDFTSALKRVSLLAHEKSRAVKFSIQNSQMVISSSNPEIGEAREEVDIEYTGEMVDIAFNSGYILDYLKCVSAETLEFHFKDRLNPGIIRSSGYLNHTYVIMPMRV